MSELGCLVGRVNLGNLGNLGNLPGSLPCCSIALMEHELESDIEEFDVDTDDDIENNRRPVKKYEEVWARQTCGTVLEGRVIPKNVSVMACNDSRPDGKWVVQVDDVEEMYALAAIRDCCKKRKLDILNAETENYLSDIEELLVKQNAPKDIKEAMVKKYKDLREAASNSLKRTVEEGIGCDGNFKKKIASDFVRDYI